MPVGKFNAEDSTTSLSYSLFEINSNNFVKDKFCHKSIKNRVVLLSSVMSEVSQIKLLYQLICQIFIKQ